MIIATIEADSEAAGRPLSLCSLFISHSFLFISKFIEHLLHARLFNMLGKFSMESNRYDLSVSRDAFFFFNGGNSQKSCNCCLFIITDFGENHKRNGNGRT